MSSSTATKKPHVYQWDRQTGERIIETSKPTCDGCGKKFRNHEEAYLGDINLVLACKKCLSSGKISETSNAINTQFLWGTIQVKP